jgi:hypothetical protein
MNDRFGSVLPGTHDRSNPITSDAPCKTVLCRDVMCEKSSFIGEPTVC